MTILLKGLNSMQSSLEDLQTFLSSPMAPSEKLLTAATIGIRLKMSTSSQLLKTF